MTEEARPRDAKGHWLPGSKPANLITSETAHAMLDKRKLKRQRCQDGAERGVIAAAAQLVDRPIASAEEAHEVLGELVTLAGGQAALKGQLREGVTGINFGLKLAAQEPASDKRQQTPTVAVQVNVSPELLRGLGIIDAVAQDTTVEDDEDA